MPSIPPIKIHRVPSVLRRKWRPAVGVAAVMLAITAFVQPWHHAQPASTRPAADSATMSIADKAAPGTKSDVAAAVAINQTATLKVPGAAPKMPWPRTGQAGISLVGGGILGVSGTQKPMPTASMAKAMTAYIVLKDHPLKPGENGPTIHVTAAEAGVVNLNIRQDQQVLRVRTGEALSEKQALNALMLKSANNVARILARWDAGSIPAFLNKMNANAAALGMKSTHYTDPSGWAATTKSTTTDQMTLGEAAMKRADFARVVSTKSAVVPIEGRIKNVNPLLGQDGIVGIKTGSMSAAGGCLMFAAKHTVAGQTVTIVGTVMGQRSNQIGDLHQAFASSKSLVESMARAVGLHQVIKAGQVVGTVPGTTRQLVATASRSSWSAGAACRTPRRSRQRFRPRRRSARRSAPSRCTRRRPSPCRWP